MTGAPPCACLGAAPRTGTAIRSSSRTAALALALASLGGCTLQAPTDEPPRPRADVLSLEVVPAAAKVQPGGAFPFRAVVSGTGAVPQAVVWTVECESCPEDPGRIDDAGVFSPWSHAPQETLRLRVVAASAVAPEVTGSAAVEIPAASVTVTPATVELFPGEHVQFRAVVDGAVDGRVDWFAWEGSIGEDGVYQAVARPSDAEEIVVARSRAHGKEGQATVVFSLRPPVVTATSGSAAPGDTLTVLGAGFDVRFWNTGVEVLFQDGTGQPLPPVRAATVAPDRLTVVVPQGAAGGPLRVRLATPGRPDAVSNAIPFERAPRLRVHAARAELAPGETTRVDVAFLGAAGSFPLTFETDAGSIADGVYAAPSSVDVPVHANVRACVTGTSICAGTTVTVLPFVVAPSPALVAAGGTLALSARRAGAAIPAAFSVGSGDGVVSPDGLLAAPASGAGSTWLLADDGASVVPVPVGVTGLGPGLLARAESDVGDPAAPLRDGVPWGASVQRIALAGARAYAWATPVGRSAPCWIDVHDLADPLRPVWLDAVETSCGAVQLCVARGRLYVRSSWLDPLEFRDVLALEVLELSGPAPVLVARSQTKLSGYEKFRPPVVDGESLYVFGERDGASGGQTLAIHDLAEGPLPEPRTVVLPLPPDAARGISDSPRHVATAYGGRAWIAYQTEAYGWAIAAWDVQADPPALLGSVPLGSFWGFLTVDGPFLRTSARDCYDRRPAAPVPVPCGFTGYIVAEDGTSHVVANDGGIALLDLSDPIAPVLGGTVAGGYGSGALAGGWYYSAEGSRGIAIYDVAAAGGPRVQATASGAPSIVSFSDSELGGGLLLATGRRSLGWDGFAAAWDLASTPPALAWWVPLGTPGRAIARAGDVLLVGLESGVDVLSLADPAAPHLLATVPLDVTALAAEGLLAFVGTSGGEVVVLDLSTPAAPLERGRITPRAGIPVRSIEVLAADRLAVALGSTWTAEGDLALLDVAAAAAPVVLALAGMREPVLDLALDGSLAVLTTPSSLLTVDVANPAAPVVLAVVPLPTTIPAPEDAGGRAPSRGVVLADGIAWVVARSSNAAGALRGFDVRDPAWPRLVVDAPLGALAASADAIAVDGARAYSSPSPYAWTELDLSRAPNVVLEEHPAPARPPGASIADQDAP